MELLTGGKLAAGAAGTTPDVAAVAPKAPVPATVAAPEAAVAVAAPVV
jgi:hypothetical protein